MKDINGLDVATSYCNKLSQPINQKLENPAESCSGSKPAQQTHQSVDILFVNPIMETTYYSTYEHPYMEQKF